MQSRKFILHVLSYFCGDSGQEIGPSTANRIESLMLPTHAVGGRAVNENLNQINEPSYCRERQRDVEIPVGNGDYRSVSQIEIVGGIEIYQQLPRGPQTRAATSKFQADQGLSKNGKLDEDTLAKLNVGVDRRR